MKKIVISFFLVLVIFIFLYNKNKIKEYSFNYNYFDGINIRIYTNNKKNIESEIKDILKEYENSDEIYNYGLELKNKSNGLVDINKSYLLNQYEYFKKNNLVPSYYECDGLNYSYIIKSFVINKIKEYLEKNKIYSYTINMRNTVLLGDSKGMKFTFALEKPYTSDYLLFLKLNNYAISTVGPYQDYYEIDDRIYHNLINPITFKQIDNYDSLTVICKNVLESEFLAHYLYYLSIEEGREILKMYDADAIWYYNGKIEYTSNIESWK